MQSFGESFNRTLICSVIVDKIDVISELIGVKLEYLYMRMQIDFKV